MRTFLWYDLETFGLNPRYDRIAQAAAIRTDMDLNIIGEPILLYSRLSPDYLPNPGSCLVTHITPQLVNSKGMPECEMISRLRDEMMVPETITVGYNSIKFDDECIRSTLYRNLFDPYEREYMNRCSRWDIINLVRATRDLRPNGMVFDKKNPETGTVSFKLTDLTEENNIDQTGAHDALVDVYATIAIAKLIKKNQPSLWKYALNHRGKIQVSQQIDLLNHTPLLYTSALFASEKGNTHPVLPLFMPDKGSEVYCFDLMRPISAHPSLDNWEDSGIVKINIKKCPFVAPLKTLDRESEKRLGFTQEEVYRKAKEVLSTGLYTEENLKTQVKQFETKQEDPDIAIYSSFITDHDKNLLKTIRTLSPESQLKSGEHLFDDDKYHKLLWRKVARNWPRSLSKNELDQWKNFCALRLLNPPVQEALSMEKYKRNVEELLNSLDTTAEDKKILLELKEYGELLESKVLGS